MNVALIDLDMAKQTRRRAFPNLALMNVALIDLDMAKQTRRRAFPNLALMKLAAWHKKQGDTVSLNFPIMGADLIYASCVFTWNKPKYRLSDEIRYGGGGFGIYDYILAPEIEHMMPDYDLYPAVNWSMGYTSRGCIRVCKFCKVRTKEGYIRAVAEPAEFYDSRFNEIRLLDNNVLASPNWRETFQWLIASGLLVDFNQGLDIRCLNDENAHYLQKMRVKAYRFAFDDMNYKSAVVQGISLMDKLGVSRRKLSFYVLVGFTNDDHALERIKLLQSYDVDIYPMIYKRDDGKEPEINLGLTETIPFHGARGNLRKFLRLAGRLA